MRHIVFGLVGVGAARVAEIAGAPLWLMLLVAFMAGFGAASVMGRDR